MFVESPKRVLIPLLAVAVAGFFGLSSFENHRINKIEFMIRDNEQNNSANLAEGDLLDNLSACGGEVITFEDEWHVEYDGALLNQKWRFQYNSPSTSPGR